ncbi:hypothetical protein [Deinococcus aquatilis]|uniref:hypothetical protein n=1 Tax=Deinococcus aquatilis TaxID=519440 RepID=UPI00039EA5DE|nr:hypothetical protein [Deinococcus aquatilis]
MRLHIFGAAGSGTTTLGRALAAELGLMHLDSDDFFWEATDPPYTWRRPTPERQQQLSTAFTSAPDGWSLSGWMGGWGDMFIPQVQAAIFIHLPPRLRPERLQARERQRYAQPLPRVGRCSRRTVTFWPGQPDTTRTQPDVTRPNRKRGWQVFPAQCCGLKTSGRRQKHRNAP